MTSQGCPWALSIQPKFPTSWYGNFRRKFPENPEIVEIPRSEPFNRKFWKFRDENRMKRKFPENWVYPTRLFSFSEILLIRDLLFSASSFERDHSELNIPRKDDGDAYSKMETLKNRFTYMSRNTSCS